MKIHVQILADEVLPNGNRRLTLELARSEGSPLAAEALLHHDLEGALRAFRYLAQKAAAGYDANDARGKKTQASIAKHLETIESLKIDVIDRLFPPRPEAP